MPSFAFKSTIESACQSQVRYRPGAGRGARRAFSGESRGRLRSRLPQDYGGSERFFRTLLLPRGGLELSTGWLTESAKIAYGTRLWNLSGFEKLADRLETARFLLLKLGPNSFELFNRIFRIHALATM